MELLDIANEAISNSNDGLCCSASLCLSHSSRNCGDGIQANHAYSCGRELGGTSVCLGTQSSYCLKGGRRLRRPLPTCTRHASRGHAKQGLARPVPTTVLCHARYYHKQGHMVATLLIGWQQCGDVGVNQASSKRIYIDTVQMVQGGGNNGTLIAVCTLCRGVEVQIIPVCTQ